MRTAVLIALVLGGTSLAAKPKRVAAPRRPAPVASPLTLPSQGPGSVTFVTTTTVYLDRGTADGLAVGNGLTVTRAGRLVGRCTVATVSEKWSTCNAQGLQIGDRITTVRALAAPPLAPAPVATAAELQARRQVVEAEALPLVDFAGGSSGLLGGGGTRLASLALSHSTFVNLAAPDGPFHTQRVDVGVYDVPIWRGLHGSADLSVINFSRRPSLAGGPALYGGDFESPVRGSTVLLVRQLEISYHSAELPLVARVGRTWTRHTPGLLMLDGAQAGWRNKDDSFEVGAYGGLLPDPVLLGVSTQRVGVGAFLMARFESGKGTAAKLLQLEARAGYAVRPLTGGKIEIALAAHTWVNRNFDAHLQLELGLLGNASTVAPGFLDAARLDFGWRPVDALRIFAGGRYQGQQAIDTLELGVTLPGQRALHADLGVTVELSDALWIGASAGTAIEFSNGLNQTRLGPEVTLPHLFGKAISLGVGYQEELGWLRGRSAWLQLTVTPVSRLRILARGNWFQEQALRDNLGLSGHEVGAALMVDLAITRWLWVRVATLGHSQVAAVAGGGGPTGATVMGQLGGQL